MINSCSYKAFSRGQLTVFLWAHLKYLSIYKGDLKANLSHKQKKTNTTQETNTKETNTTDRFTFTFFTFTFIHLADAFIQSDLQLLYMSEVTRLWRN